MPRNDQMIWDALASRHATGDNKQKKQTHAVAVSIAAGQRHEPTNDNDKDIIVTMIDIAATT